MSKRDTQAMSIMLLAAIFISTLFICDTIDKKQVVVYKTVEIEKPFQFPPGCEYYLIKTKECLYWPPKEH